MARRLIRRTLAAVGWMLLGVVVALVACLATLLENRPDLAIWHTVDLDTEFTTESDLVAFKEYLLLEDRLFARLDELVYASTPLEFQNPVNRYHRGSLADPAVWETNWNRTFERCVDEPKGGVLLLHGLSDSPYSMRSLADHVSTLGFYALALRLPGHGTAPSGLVNVRWEDMEAAVALAMPHVVERSGGGPIYIIGYSNGGALGLRYVLQTLVDETLPTVDGLVLISPEIGISKLAALAVWQSRLGHLLGVPKLAWQSIAPEYDPFKYNSFAINAGDQAYRLTANIQKTIRRLPPETLSRLPSIVAFQSVVDATVSAPALIEGLFDRLPPGRHELVLFDVNQLAILNPLLDASSRDYIATLLRTRPREYSLTIVTNEDRSSRNIVIRQVDPRAGSDATTKTDMFWPEGVYSLSHVALPFPPDDPLYGGYESQDNSHIRLGNVKLRGERGVLRVSPTDLYRLRWNPFYEYLEQRIDAFIRPGPLRESATANSPG